MSKTNFETYLEKQLENPAVKAEFDEFGAHIRSVQALLAYLDDRCIELGLNKTELAKKLNLQPSNVRRWFTAPKQNPSFASMLELANCLDLEVKLVPKTQIRPNESGADFGRSIHHRVS